MYFVLRFCWCVSHNLLNETNTRIYTQPTYCNENQKKKQCIELLFSDTSKSTFPLRSIIISPQCIYETKDFHKNTQINTITFSHMKSPILILCVPFSDFLNFFSHTALITIRGNTFQIDRHTYIYLLASIIRYEWIIYHQTKALTFWQQTHVQNTYYSLIPMF